MTYSKTTQFLLPLVEWEGTFSDIEQDGFINAYCGYVGDGEEEWGKYLYFLFEEHIPEHREQELRTNPLFQKMEKVDGNRLLFRFKPRPEDVENVMTPFINGKYSKISRDFADAYYPRLTMNVVEKADVTRNMWEERIGKELPEDAEVWPRPEKEDEIYGYKSKDHVQREQDQRLLPERDSISGRSRRKEASKADDEEPSPTAGGSS